LTSPDETIDDTQRQQSRLTYGFKLLISAALLGILVYRATGNQTLIELWGQPKKWEWLLLGGVAVSAGYTISFVRWWVLTSGLGLRMSVGEAIRWGLVSQPFQLVSFGVAGGDLLRIYYLCQRHPDRKTHVATTVVLDRAIGLTVMFAAVAMVGWFIDWPALAAADVRRTVALSWLWRLSIGLVGAVLIAGLTLGFIPLGSGSAPSLAGIPSRRVRTVLVNLLQLLPGYRARPATLVVAVLLSLANVACLSGGVACVARSLTTEIPTVWDHLLITPISLIAGAAPLPGGLGSQELVMSWLYAAFSTEQRHTDYGFLVAVGFRVLTLGIAGIGWLLYLQSATRGRPAN
jgi:uncharacterized membrane protein YbhN (UPF0104 family)